MKESRTFLENIIEKKQEDIQLLYDKADLSWYKEQVNLLSEEIFFDFYKALSSDRLSLISEVKKASPSKGLINPNMDPVSLAKMFQKFGASVLSVLTEKYFFLGSLDYIHLIKESVSLPVLRKDFIVDPIQVYESKLIGADAILLIGALLSKTQCHDLFFLAEELGLDVLYEIHNIDELQKFPLNAKRRLIGINNRNLNTFEVDISQAKQLVNEVRNYCSGDCLTVAESGYSDIIELKELEKNGFSSVLIGEGLVKNKDLINYFL